MSKPRDYQGDEITVGYDIRICIHAKECVNGLPAVFDVAVKPWVNANGASADAIAKTIDLCPSGALTYTRVDGQAEQPQSPCIQVTKNGPLYVHGQIALTAPDRHVVETGMRAALCRCGESANKPFCDQTHQKNGFSAG